MPFDESVRFACVRDVTGECLPVQVGLRNGLPVPFFVPTDLLPPCLRPEPVPEPSGPTPPDLFQNLSAREQRILLRLADGRSVAEVAATERVSRPRLYEIIRGKAGRGGMVRKNPYARRFWQRRQEESRL